MSSPNYSISKTSFLKFEQCQKAFFLYKNHPYLRDKPSIDKQLTFKRGHDVGYFAQQLFPGGIDVSKQTKSASQGVSITANLIENKTPVIYEATFLFNSVLIMVDILCLQNGLYQAYEVKSSMKISENYLKDAYLQYYVLKNSLPGFDDLFLVTLNPDYVMDEQIDSKKLFRKRSVKIKAEENFLYFRHRISEALSVLDQNSIPNIAIGKHCFRPYQCDYFNSCWKNTIHDSSIFNLPYIDKGKLFEWYDSGLRNIDDVTDAMLEKESHIRIKNSFITKQPIINRQKIETFLAKIKYPAIAMDMEVWSAAIPQLPGTKPFEHIPFLVCFYDGITSTYFFAENKLDERKQFAEKLIELSAAYESVIVYDKTMEISIIDALGKKYPEYSTELTQLKNKIIDVFDIFLEQAFYHPNFKNNLSLKVISSQLLQDIDYSKITSGLEAMNYFEQYRASEEVELKEELKNQLVQYCNTDSLLTLKLIDYLQSVIK